MFAALSSNRLAFLHYPGYMHTGWMGDRSGLCCEATEKLLCAKRILLKQWMEDWDVSVPLSYQVL